MERPPVSVIGGGLAGMAAAARLAKLGHAVELYDEAGALGGTWTPYELDEGVRVDGAPSVLGFPAPWRDLFRKSGRPLDAELARHGYAVVPAEPPALIFADETELVLPTDRGGQYSALRGAYGVAIAERWQGLLDRLDDVWQALRPLGFEAELTNRTRLKRTTRQRLLHRRTVADLATEMAHPQLSALIRSVAYRSGADPEQTPALAAVELAIARTFGRWQVQPEGAGDAGRSSVLVDALRRRLDQRQVAVRLQTRVSGLRTEAGRVAGLRTTEGDLPASAVIWTADPWSLDALLPADLGKPLRRDIHRLRPARAPAIRHSLVDETASDVRETIILTADGVPTVRYRRPAGERSIRTIHDFRMPTVRPSAGVAWEGFRTFLRRPAVTTMIPGLFLAGPFSPAGAAPSSVVLSGALASRSCQDYLSSRGRADS